MTKRLPRVLSVEQIEQLLDSCPTDDIFGIRDRALFELIYSCGLRESEAVNLTMEHAWLDKGLVLVMGKGSKERMVPMGERARAAIAEYLARSRPVSAWGPNVPELFVSGRVGN